MENGCGWVKSSFTAVEVLGSRSMETGARWLRRRAVRDGRAAGQGPQCRPDGASSLSKDRTLLVRGRVRGVDWLTSADFGLLTGSGTRTGSNIFAAPDLNSVKESSVGTQVSNVVNCNHSKHSHAFFCVFLYILSTFVMNTRYNKIALSRPMWPPEVFTVSCREAVQIGVTWKHKIQTEFNQHALSGTTVINVYFLVYYFWRSWHFVTSKFQLTTVVYD